MNLSDRAGRTFGSFHFLSRAICVLISFGLFLDAPLWAQPAAPVTPVAATNGTNSTITKAPMVTADAVQEAFVRVAERVKPSVVTIYAERALKKRTGRGESTPPKPPDKSPNKPNPPGNKPGTPPGTPPGTKPEPKSPKPAPPESEEPDEDEEDGFGLPFPFGPPDEPQSSLGTGMVVSTTGYILTNYHVVKDASVIRVIFNADSEHPERPTAKVVGFDEESDLAILQVKGRTDLRAVEMANSDEVRIGEWAIAIGAPFDQAQTVTVGVVSAKGRHLEKDDRLSLQDYIQTDASINPGNSGGPLVNLEGKVIGINTAILSPSRFNVGIGFAVPSNTVSQYLPLLLSGKRIERGFLGIQYVPLDGDVAREFGVEGGMQIGALAKREGKFIGPAKEAGLQEGDIITAVNGQSIKGSDEFRRIVSTSPPGTKLALSVVRPVAEGTEKRAVTVTLGDWAVQSSADGHATAAPELLKVNAPRLGLEIENAEKLDAMKRELFGLEVGARGAIITEVVPGSPADDAELRRGLRIVRARVSGGAWQTIANKEAFLRIENSLVPDARVLLQLRDRDNVSLYKVIVVAPRAEPTTQPSAENHGTVPSSVS